MSLMISDLQHHPIGALLCYVHTPPMSSLESTHYQRIVLNEYWAHGVVESDVSVSVRDWPALLSKNSIETKQWIENR